MSKTARMVMKIIGASLTCLSVSAASRSVCVTRSRWLPNTPITLTTNCKDLWI